MSDRFGPSVNRPGLPFVCAYADEVVTFTLVGSIDHRDIAAMVERVAPARQVVLDVAKAEGAYSTIIAACIQLSIRIGEAVRVRGADQRLGTTLLQMNLQRFAVIEGARG